MTGGQILVHVEAGAMAERRLRYAVSMARQRNARLVGLTVRLSPAAATSAMIGDAQAIAAFCDASIDSCREAGASFERVTRDCGVTVEWREAHGTPLDAIVAESASADFVLLGRGDQRDLTGGMYVVQPADVIMAAGCPVIVVPDQAPPEFRGERILLAWKSTAQAGRAARDAMPLLGRAKSVVLTEIIPASPSDRYEISAQTMAAYLESHGVHVSFIQAEQAEEPGEQLIRIAGQNACDMIVAGAYGHSRFREWVLGGVTRSLLASAITCVMSH